MKLVGFGVLFCIAFFIQESLSFSYSSEKNSSQDNWISRLYNDKLKGYNKDARPVMDPTHKTNVVLGFYLSNVHIDDVKQQVLVNGWTLMSWTDEHLSWEPKNYMNIEWIHFDQNDIWTPDIAVFNSAYAEGVVPFEKVPVVVDHLGRTYWVPPTFITVHCNLDMSKWPTDQHECTVSLGSWTHHSEQIQIQIYKHNDSTDVMLNNYEENSHWDLMGAKVTKNIIQMEEQENHIEINFTFTLKRLARMHATYITTSAIVVMVIVLISYSLPLDNFFSRLIMHLFALGILVSCYLTLFSTLPANGGPVPFVVRYYAGTTILTLISLLATICLTNCTCCESDASSRLGKRMAGMVTPSPNIRVGSSRPYEQLEGELFDDIESPPVAPDYSSPSNNKLMVAKQVRSVINVLLFVLFTVAYMVDYFILRSVAY